MNGSNLKISMNTRRMTNQNNCFAALASIMMSESRVLVTRIRSLIHIHIFNNKGSYNENIHNHPCIDSVSSFLNESQRAVLLKRFAQA